MTEPCYRCNGPLVDVTPKDIEDLRFYVCGQCESRYTRSENGRLHDRWGMPLTLALYELIFEENTEDRFNHIYVEMIRKGPAFVRHLLKHLDAELNDPRQYVSDIYSFKHLDEVGLRTFLLKLSDELHRFQHLPDAPATKHKPMHLQD